MSGVAYLADAAPSLLSTFRLIDTIFQRSGSLQVAQTYICRDLYIMLKAESKQRKPVNFEASQRLPKCMRLKIPTSQRG